MVLCLQLQQNLVPFLTCHWKNRTGAIKLSADSQAQVAGIYIEQHLLELFFGVTVTAG